MSLGSFMSIKVKVIDFSFYGSSAPRKLTFNFKKIFFGNFQ